MLIQVARATCIGAAPCVAVAGDVFQLDAEGKAIVVGEITDQSKIRLAAESCPVRAIYLYNDDKKQIYPPPEENPRPYQEN